MPNQPALEAPCSPLRDRRTLTLEDVLRPTAVAFIFVRRIAQSQEHQLCWLVFAGNQLYVRPPLIGHFKGYRTLEAGVDLRRSQMGGFADSCIATTSLHQPHEVVGHHNALERLHQH